MIGFGIFFCDKLCKVETNGIYAILIEKEFAEGYAKELSEAFNLEYKIKKVTIEVKEDE